MSMGFFAAALGALGIAKPNPRISGPLAWLLIVVGIAVFAIALARPAR
jgi:hypothetical protein